MMIMLSRRARTTEVGASIPPRSPMQEVGAAVGRESLGKDRRVPVVCGLLVLLVAIIFGQSIRYEFVNFDDPQYVLQNVHVRNGITADNVAWALTATYATNWHPLTWISHMVDCRLYGLWAGGHHLTNVVLHAGNAVLLFLVLRRMTEGLWPSAFVAAIFAAHPLRAESVAWVAERKDVLSGLFFLLTLWAYAAYARSARSLWRYLLVALLFALGLMAKPMLVTLPALLLLLDYWPLGRTCSERGVLDGRRAIGLVAEKVPLMALAAGSCAVTVLAQRTATMTLDEMPMTMRLANSAITCVAYIGKWLWPSALSVFYPPPADGVSPAVALQCLGLLCVISAVAAWLWRACPYCIVGWLWYLGMLVPVMGIVKTGVQSMADRYTYLPQIGLAVAVAWGAADLAARGAQIQRLTVGVACLVLCLVSVAAWRQTQYWQTSETLYTHNLEAYPTSYVAHNNLAVLLQGAGKLPEAIEHFRRAAEIHPMLFQPQMNLAVTLVEAGRFAEAVGPCRQAIAIQPDDARAHATLAAALANMGRLPEAIDAYARALRINPDEPNVQFDLARTLSSAGDVRGAMEHYRQVVRLNPRHLAARNNLASALLKVGRMDDAMQEYRQILALAPDYLIGHLNLARCLVEAGRKDEAQEHLRAALRIAKAAGDERMRGAIASQLRELSH